MANAILCINLSCVCNHSPMELRESHVAVGPHQGMGLAERESLTCILCQEEQEVMAGGPSMVLTACVQRSTVLTQSHGRPLNVPG